MVTKLGTETECYVVGELDRLRNATSMNFCIAQSFVYPLPFVLFLNSAADKHRHEIHVNNQFLGTASLYTSPELLLKIGTYQRSLAAIEAGRPVYLGTDWNRLCSSQIDTPVDVAALLFAVGERCNDYRTLSWYRNRRDPIPGGMNDILTSYLGWKHDRLGKILQDYVGGYHQGMQGLEELNSDDVLAEILMTNSQSGNPLGDSKGFSGNIERRLGTSGFASIIYDRIVVNSWLSRRQFGDRIEWIATPFGSGYSRNIADFAILNEAVLSLFHSIANHI